MFLSNPGIKVGNSFFGEGVRVADEQAVRPDLAVVVNDDGIAGPNCVDDRREIRWDRTVHGQRQLGKGNGMPEKDRSANGTSASVGLAGRIMSSNRRSWLGRMRPDRGGAAELPIHAQGRICLVSADRS